MPLYLFSCPLCETSHEVVAPILEGPPVNLTCLDCDALLQRVYTPPAVKTPFVPHFNESIGRYVSNDREFRDSLKQGAEDTYRRTGYETNYVPVEIGEITASTDKDEAQQRRMFEESR